MDPEHGYVGSYDPYTTPAALPARLVELLQRAPVARRGFIWTGFDYRGEPSPYQWPNIGSQYGIIDRCGFPGQLLYFQAWWVRSPCYTCSALELAGA